MDHFDRIVAAYDFSPNALHALAVAETLATKLGAELHVVHVVPEPRLAYPTIELGSFAPPLIPESVRKEALETLDEETAHLRRGVHRVRTHVLEGSAVDVALADFIREIGADLLVMGTHGRTGLAHLLMGSVAERTLRRATCPVLTVRSPGTGSASSVDDDVEAVDLATRRREGTTPDIAGAHLRSPGPDGSSEPSS
ncbi:MAG: universal stress protein [Deltaproteobacteria bacterium]|nr:universal stress protein [Deltaproteobacteria bacterium]